MLYMCGTWPLSTKLYFRRNRIWTIPHIWESIVYIPTKFRESTLIAGRDMPPKRNTLRALWRRNYTSGSNFDTYHLSWTFMCMILQNTKKSLNARLSYMRFHSSCAYYTFKPTLPTAQRHSAVMQAVYYITPLGDRNTRVNSMPVTVK